MKENFKSSWKIRRSNLECWTLISKNPVFHVISDDKDQKKSQKVLSELENIDDECDQNDIAFVKIDDDKEAQEWGIDEIPTIVRN